MSSVSKKSYVAVMKLSEKYYLMPCSREAAAEESLICVYVTKYLNVLLGETSTGRTHGYKSVEDVHAFVTRNLRINTFETEKRTKANDDYLGASYMYRTGAKWITNEQLEKLALIVDSM